MSGFEFGDRLNWNLVTRLDLSAVKVNDEIAAQIPARSVLVDRRILMVGCRSLEAPPPAGGLAVGLQSGY